MRNSTTIGFIGFGEVGQTFARGLLAKGASRIVAYDILFDDAARRDAHLAKTAAAGAVPAASAAEAAREARVVISAVTADQAERVAREAVAYLAPGQIFFDVNSASPATKSRAAATVNPGGAHYVEGAVMAAVLGPGLQVPILAGGPHAESAATILNALGMNITPVTTEPGRASAMKLCRSIVMKGLEAIVLDCAAAAKQWGVEKEVWDSLRGTYPSLDWPKLAEQMHERVTTHGIRRAAEMREAAAMLKDLGLDPTIAAATADRHERIATAAKETKNP
ncbi:MAG: NAD(P)-dependent oxidoreductase [Alphaproteobacteria bacterium]|nr:NAD(P)-dependent oxidoreductase [Alphaproteobacteria bacterium]